MKKFCYILTLSFFIGGILTSCKKDKNTAPPEITILSPNENSSFSVFDTLKVKAEISDENQLLSVSVQLLEENLTPAQSVFRKSISGKEYSFLTDYIISDSQLSSGFYFLKVSASDGVNESKEYIKIYISESATTSKGIVIISLISFNKIEVSILGNNDSVQFFVTVNCDYAASSVSSENQYINILGKIIPGLNSYRINDKSIQWSVPSVGSMPYFENLNFYNEMSYVCYKDGRITGYDKNGNSQFNATAGSAFYPEKSFLLNTKLLVQEKEIAGIKRQLAVYYSSGALQQTYMLPLNVVAFAWQDDNNVFLFGNDSSGKGKILLYNLNDNYTWSPYSIPGGAPINDAVRVNTNEYLIALNHAVFKYFYSPGNFIELINKENARIKYDEVNNRVITESANNLDIYSYENGGLISSYTHSQPILDFHLLNTK